MCGQVTVAIWKNGERTPARQAGAALGPSVALPNPRWLASSRTGGMACASGSELEADAELGSERGATRRNFVEHAVLQPVHVLALARNGGKRWANGADAIGNWSAGAGRGDEAAVIRVGIEVAAVGEIEKVGGKTERVALAELEILGYAGVPGEEVRLAGGIAGQEEGLAVAKLDDEAIVV